MLLKLTDFRSIGLLVYDMYKTTSAQISMDLVRKYILLELPPYWSIGSRWCRETMGLWLPPIVERAFQRTERTNSCTASVFTHM